MAASTIAVALYGNTAQAQSADALLDKLVDKGVLSVKEANELRDEADTGFRKAYQVKSGMPDWVTAMKINGDFRGRYENFSSENDAFVDRSRWRYRLRLGVVATVKDNFEVGMRLGSGDVDGGIGSGLDPISQNQSLQNNGSKKGIFLDLAYGKWSFINTKSLTESITIGKMENPFVFSDMVFDGDYTPEGAGYNLIYRASDAHTIKLNAGAFVLDEIGGDSKDPYMYGAQVRWDATWSKNIASSMGIAGLSLVNEQGLTNGAVPNISRGNTRDAGTGVLANNYNPIVADAALTYTFEDGIPLVYAAPFPVKFAGEYMNNLAASDRETAWALGITFGKSGKKGLWEIGYRYKDLGGDAWYEEFTDSDFGAYYAGTFPNGGSGAGYGPGTNVRGHIVKASFTPYDVLTLGITYFRANLIDEVPVNSNSQMTRLQVDAVLKF